MPCLVGITTDVELCRSFRSARVEGLSDWQVLSSHCTRWTARYAAEDVTGDSECELDLGASRGTIARWCVFTFQCERKLIDTAVAAERDSSE